jgi:hypothetical protein
MDYNMVDERTICPGMPKFICLSASIGIQVIPLHLMMETDPFSRMMGMKESQ